MNLENRVLTEKPREESGSKTSRKYQFQKDLSLYILLKEHSSREDYVFLFDFHEDLIISNSSNSLLELEAYQIKSKDKGNWTINQLTKQPKGKSSILGKLYHNRIFFEDSIKSLNFISNGHFNFKNLKNGDKSENLTEIFARNLNEDDVDACDTCIKNEHLIPKTDFKDLGLFIVTSLSNKDSSAHCVGTLAALITSINPDNKINPQLAYEQVLREVTRKTNETVGDKSFSHISEIFEVKGISKKQFVEFLSIAGLYKSVDEEWAEIKSSLESSGMGYLEIMKYKSAWREMNARLVAESGNIPLREIENSIKDAISLETDSLQNMKLNDVVNQIYQLIERGIYEEYFTKCLIIRMLNES